MQNQQNFVVTDKSFQHREKTFKKFFLQMKLYLIPRRLAFLDHDILETRLQHVLKPQDQQGLQANNKFYKLLIQDVDNKSATRNCKE